MSLKGPDPPGPTSCIPEAASQPPFPSILICTKAWFPEKAQLLGSVPYDSHKQAPGFPQPDRLGVQHGFSWVLRSWVQNSVRGEGGGSCRCPRCHPGKLTPGSVSPGGQEMGSLPAVTRKPNSCQTHKAPSTVSQRTGLDCGGECPVPCTAPTSIPHASVP